MNPERYSRDLTRVAQEILPHLAAEHRCGSRADFELHAKRPGGFSEERMRAVNENARVLRFDSFSFEKE
ncbi:MAG: hypothetical protein M3072_15855 [Candidatus Dormibacteraeota bacterium]|nr:hypothetical protein [Candidatus Dormibacteraeota bacterium]